MNKLILIDADSLVYHSGKDTLEESIVSLNERIHNMFNKTEATHYCMFISQGKYFRHNIDPNYKFSREKYRNNSSNKWVKVLKQYLIAKWNAQWMDLVEADDLVAYWYNQPIIWGYINTQTMEYGFTHNIFPVGHKDTQLVEKIVCSPDKDILQSIIGKHFNYSYKLEDKNDPNSIIKGWWIETNIDQSYITFWKSMICGDTTDGVKGVEGLGEKAFEKLGAIHFQYGDTLEELVLMSYINKYGTSQGIYEFQKNYRLLHMLDCDEDFIREVGGLPKFPIISEVSNVIKQEEVSFNNIEF